ncbi:aryl hydrocarbon receptor isoform X2 [Parasteatoda tepidariorum]|uniref:aryl hydrocarbon receptor isoform X2 n=1 Tax=Parasteatoda tepidariorum TaxID=114398 RepID=UPI00077FAE58|nr:aryl hydrocarbon receptor isoform X2 [Parasteatoda tepidariorum]
MNHLGTMYATKRRRRNSKSVRVPPKDGQTKSNPSKRHRERLNAELDTLANLLPFEQSVLSKLDKLSILRLSVSYLRTKSYFQVALRREKDSTDLKPRDLLYSEMLMEGDLILQALNGFLMILTCDGEVFYTSHTVETYLGFHQSDICHQSVYELVHSEDREELQRHLLWNSQLPPERTDLNLQQTLENCQYLERNFTVRFRCLLDNTSGFLRLDIRGRIKILHGQNQKEPPLALFAVCTPFGPPSLLEMPQKDSMFKSKHKLDLSLVSMDTRGKQLLGFSDSELSNKGGYDLVHYDDLAYVASAHQELLKTGASGLIAYRLLAKDLKYQWLQTSARLVYKNSKPDFILCTHRPLMEEEGRDLLGKRTMDFKVTYLDSGLATMNDRSGMLSDSDFIMRCQRNRRYKSQIRDLLSCRKRKVPDTYIEDTPYNNMYTYSSTENGLSPYATVPQNIFTAAIDNSRFLSAENFLHYRHLGGYYPDYSHQYTSNGFLDMARFSTYPDGSQFAKEEKYYPCQLNGEQNNKPSCCEDVRLMTSADLNCFPSTDCINVLKPHLRDISKDNKSAFTNDTRQSVLMWGNSLSTSHSIFDSKLCPHLDTNACKWSAATTPKSSSPQNSTSPASGKVAPYTTTAYHPDPEWHAGSLATWRPHVSEERSWTLPESHR